MELDIRSGSEDKPKRGPCPFYNAKKGLFSCGIKVETCNHNDNIPSRCGRYWALADKLIRRIRARCVTSTCKKIEFNGKWFKRREDIFIPGTNIPIPSDIWEKCWNSLPNVFCRKCLVKNKEERK